MSPQIALTKSKHLFPMFFYLVDQKESVSRLIQKAHLPSGCFDNPECLIPVPRAGEFRELAARKTGLSDLALVAAKPLQIFHLGAFGEALYRAPTLANLLTRVRDLSVNESSNLEIQLCRRLDGDLWFGVRSLRIFDEVHECHSMLHTLYILLKVVRLVQHDWAPTEIETNLIKRPWVHQAILSLGTTPKFGQRNTGFIVPETMLAMPILASEMAKYASTARSTVSISFPPTNSDKLRFLITSYSKERWLSLEQMSEVIGISIRSVQRVLSAEKLTYSQVVEDVRTEQAAGLLENLELSMVDISRQLGYKHQGDFTRAFSRWYSMTPSAYRNRRRALMQ